MRGALLEEAQGSDNPREIYSHEDYVSLVHHSGQVCCFIYEYIMLVYSLFSVARKSEWIECQILQSRRTCPLGVSCFLCDFSPSFLVVCVFL